MIKISDQDKSDLEEFKKSRVFWVLKRIEKDANDELFSRLAKFNIDDEKDRETIKKYQIYQQAREEFFQNIESYVAKSFEYKQDLT